MPGPIAAKAPFNKKKADIIICSSDNVGFHVFSQILSESSPFFEDMFSLTQPPSNSTSDVIHVAEDSETMDALFRICYPIPNPELEDELSLLFKVHQAAIKYQIDIAETMTWDLLEYFFDNQPLEAFALSCKTKLEKGAQLAAQAWKCQLIARQESTTQIKGNTKLYLMYAEPSFVPEMRQISSACYLRLLDFLCADRPLGEKVLFTEPGSPFGLVDYKGLATSAKDDLVTFASLGKADVILCSQDGEEFQVHKLVLSLARAEKLLEKPLTTHDSRGGKRELPAYGADISGGILAELLRLCYPGATTDLLDISLIPEILAAANAYDIKMVADMVRMTAERFKDRYPMELYFLAVRCGWVVLAQEAAAAASKLRLEEKYVPGMENTPAEALHNLLRYQYECTNAISQVVLKYTSGETEWETAGVPAGATLSNYIPPSISYAVVETELEKAKESERCPDEGRHWGPFYQVGDQYDLSAKDWLNLSRTIDAEIREAQAKVLLDVAWIKQELE